MAALSVENVALAGLVATYNAVNSDETINISNDERVMLHVKNADASPTTVTITAVKTSVDVHGVGKLTVADEEIIVADGTEAFIGPFTQGYIGANGDVAVAYSNVTSITAAAIKCKRPTANA